MNAYALLPHPERESKAVNTNSNDYFELLQVGYSVKAEGKKREIMEQLETLTENEFQ